MSFLVILFYAKITKHYAAFVLIVPVFKMNEVSRADSLFFLLSRLGLGKLFLAISISLKYWFRNDLISLLIGNALVMHVSFWSENCFFFYHTQKRGANQQKKRSKVGVHVCLELHDKLPWLDGEFQSDVCVIEMMAVCWLVMVGLFLFGWFVPCFFFYL